MNAKKAPSKNSLKTSISKNILAIVVTGITLVIVTLVLLHIYTRQNKSVDVPQVKGLQLKEASVLLKAQGLNLVVIDSLYNRDAIPGDRKSVV